MDPNSFQPQTDYRPQPDPNPSVPLIEARETDGLPATPPAPSFASAPGMVSPDWNAPSPQPFNEPQQSYAAPTPHSYAPPQPDFTPPAPTAQLAASDDQLRPVPVVRVLSPVGVEYVFLTCTLFTGAIGLASALLAMANGKFDFAVLAFPAAMLLVSVPVFALLFLRLKQLELRQPSLALDPSKRRSTQFTQVTSFAVCLFTLIGLVFAIFGKIGGQSSISIGKVILDALCVLVVAGGILAYYWRDEHKAR